MSLAKLNVKKGDTVVVLSGKDKGKQGKVIAAQPKKGKVIVEGVNKVKRAASPSNSNFRGKEEYAKWIDSKRSIRRKLLPR